MIEHSRLVHDTPLLTTLIHYISGSALLVQGKKYGSTEQVLGGGGGGGAEEFGSQTVSCGSRFS